MVKKVLKLLTLFRLVFNSWLMSREDELNEKKLISKLIKLCGIETAKYL